MPAVSIRFNVTFPIRTLPSTKSLVVPAISVTIALSSSNHAFNKEDFPTFGFPTITVSIPERMNVA